MLFNILSSLSVLLPILLAVAFITLIERKWLAIIQRRVGPNIVGIFGLLQPFADALKLIIKENLVPGHSNKFLFYLSSFISLVFSLLAVSVISFTNGLQLFNLDLTLIFTIAISSLGIYGVLLAGWSANSKYALIGSLRSTAQIVSYELIFGSCILIIAMISSSWNYNLINENQTIIYLVPLFSLFIIFFTSVLAETNRTPFDLNEAESELVSGFMTEHSSVPFVIFFLAEYCSIVVLSIVTSLLFLGGTILFVNPLISSFILGLKTTFCCFLFVLVRATLPRIRYDQLIEFCWTEILPLVIALVLFIPILFTLFLSL